MFSPCYLLRHLFAFLVLWLLSCVGIFKKDANDPIENNVPKAPKLTDNNDFGWASTESKQLSTGSGENWYSKLGTEIWSFSQALRNPAWVTVSAKWGIQVKTRMILCLMVGDIGQTLLFWLIVLCDQSGEWGPYWLWDKCCLRGLELHSWHCLCVRLLSLTGYLSSEKWWISIVQFSYLFRRALSSLYTSLPSSPFHFGIIIFPLLT